MTPNPMTREETEAALAGVMLRLEDIMFRASQNVERFRTRLDAVCAEARQIRAEIEQCEADARREAQEAEAEAARLTERLNAMPPMPQES